MNLLLISKDLKRHLILNSAWEAFLGNVTNEQFTRFVDPHMQFVEAFSFKNSPEGEQYWKDLYYKLCE
jgi:hypothetical protein